MKKLLLTLFLMLLFASSASAQNTETCGNKFVSAEEDGRTKDMIFMIFKNKSDKEITITGVGLWSKDKKTIKEETREIYLKPYGKVNSSLQISDINMDVAGSWVYRCKFGIPKSVSNEINSSKPSFISVVYNSFPTFFWYILGTIVVLIIFNKILSPNESEKNKKDQSVKHEVLEENILKVSENKTSQKKIDSSIKTTIDLKKNHSQYASALAFAFWIMWVGGNIISNIIFRWSDSIFFLVIAIIWFCIASFTVFACASDYKESAKAKGLTYGWATAAQLTVVILTLSAIGNYLRG
jgi:hypothetical protein